VIDVEYFTVHHTGIDQYRWQSEISSVLVNDSVYLNLLVHNKKLSDPMMTSCTN
jgi:hypothetical protein